MKKKIIILIVMVSMSLLSGNPVLAAGRKPTDSADKTVNEAGGQNSNGKSNDKGNKITKEKDKLIIKNQKGKVVKEISLKPETKVEIEPKDLSWNLKKEKQNVKKETRKNVVLSKNEKFAAIVKNEKNISVFEDGKEISARGEGAVTGEVVVLNSAGKVLFEKKFSKNIWAHPEPLISDNAEHIAVFTRASGGVGVESRAIIYVLNKKGEIILTFPTEEDYNEGYRTGNSPKKISPNGRYLAIDIYQILQRTPYKERRVTRFYDLKNNTFWDAGARYVVFEILNNGIAEVDNPWNPVDKTDKINLKEHLEK